MDTGWQNWIKDGLSKGCDREEMRAILLKNRFSPAEIARYLDGKAAEIQNSANSIDYAALTRIRITRTGTPVETDKMQLYTLDDFMTPEECDTLVAHSETNLRQSTVGTDYVDFSHRTSSSHDLYAHLHPLVPVINTRMSEVIGIHSAFADVTQIQHYAVGQEFKPHCDFFYPGTPPFEKYATKIGNRTWTFMVYLNDTPKGGGTHFTVIDHVIYPKKGMAVIWNNLDATGTPNANTMHAGMPVEEGAKIIITKWFRERCTQPMILP